MIKSINIKKLYQDEDISYHFHDDVNFIIGDNGNFKTTILEIINLVHLCDFSSLRKYDMDLLEIQYEDKNKFEAVFLFENLDNLNKLTLTVRDYENKIRNTYVGYLDSLIRDKEKLVKSFYMIKNSSNQLITSADNEIDDLIIGFNQYPIKALYMPISRIFNRVSTYGDEETLGQKINTLIAQQQSKLRIAKLNYSEDFKTKVFEELFKVNSTKRSRLNIYSKEKLLSLTDFVSSLDIKSDELSKNIQNLILLHENASLYYDTIKDLNAQDKLNQFFSDQKNNKSKSFMAYKNILDAQAQFSIIDSLINEMEIWKNIELELSRPLNKFKKAMKDLFDYNPNIEITIKDDHFVYNKTLRNDNIRPIPIESLSSGEKHLISIIATITMEENGGLKYSTFLIDEPEISFHVDWQYRIIDIITESKSDEEVQLIFATHSPQILKSNLSKILRKEDYDGIY